MLIWLHAPLTSVYPVLQALCWQTPVEQVTPVDPVARVQTLPVVPQFLGSVWVLMLPESTQALLTRLKPLAQLYTVHAEAAQPATPLATWHTRPSAPLQVNEKRQGVRVRRHSATPLTSCTGRSWCPHSHQLLPRMRIQ